MDNKKFVELTAEEIRQKKLEDLAYEVDYDDTCDYCSDEPCECSEG